MRIFVECLIDHETRGHQSSKKKTPACFPVVEKLRLPLSTLMGDVGFNVLLSRALMLAKAEVSWLRAVHVKADGSWEGLDEPKTDISADEVLEGRVALLTQLLGLLVAFIGEGLTLRLVHEVWPKVAVHDLDFNEGDKNEKT
jgi:hypothetical protein